MLCAVENENDLAGDHVAELFALVHLVRHRPRTGLQRDESGIDRAVDGLGNEQLEANLLVRLRSQHARRTAEDHLLGLVLAEKVGQGDAEDIEDLRKGRDRGRRSIVLELADEPLGEVGARTELFLGHLLRDPECLDSLPDVHARLPLRAEVEVLDLAAALLGILVSHVLQRSEFLR